MGAEIREALRALGQASALQIAQHLGDSTSKISRSLAQLRAQGLVVLDARTMLYTLAEVSA